MQKLLLRLSPFFFLLLFFSCAKDQELDSFEPTTEILQAKEGGHDGKPCDIPCRQPDFIHITDISGCSAVLDWGFETKTCGTFLLQLQNLATGDFTYIDPATSPYLLTDLEPCTQYTIGVSHVTDNCASIPLKLSFQTECKKCKSCDIKCKDPDFAFVDNIGLTEATVNFGFNTLTCGYFIAQLKNNATGTYTYIDPAVSPLVLTGLDPCTSYTIGIAHVTDICAKVPTKITFTTNCPEYCDAEGLSYDCLYGQYITLTSDQHPGIWSADPVAGYIDATDQVVDVTPGGLLDWTPAGVCLCNDIEGDIYLKLWIDSNMDYVFDASELIYVHTIPWPGGSSSTVSCFDIPVSASYLFPNVSACGMRARFIVTQDVDAGPCGSFSTGQVIDFTVDSTDC